MDFNLSSKFSPKGDQPQAISKLSKGILSGKKLQTLLGVTGSGKTFTVANVIANVNKPTLVIAHNKTLAAQLFNEFQEFFPENRVEYFVSYYDYYQPESYLPATDTYIEKDAQINSKIEQMRLSATMSLLTRKDVIVVSSVSCIYGLGNPENYERLALELRREDEIKRYKLILRLVEMQYERNDTELLNGRFRVKGDTIDIIPAYSKSLIRVELFGDEIERIVEISKYDMKVIKELDYYYLFPARHFVMEKNKMKPAILGIKNELKKILPKMGEFEAHRLKQRTQYDLEMIEETGYCKGIENYSRFFDGRKKGEAPYTLIDYFPDDFLVVVDESHRTLPQIRGMFNGDKSRKETLVNFGFRLPSALDNRPLNFNEFEKKIDSAIFISATPGDYEFEKSDSIIEQIIRPTGLIDPKVIVRPVESQVSNILNEIKKEVKKNNRVLITTLTKKLSEELTNFLAEEGIKVRYLHSEIETLDRTEIIRQLRLGKFDVLVGINLLREGLDIPEVSLVGILDADKEGFLRDQRSLIQTIGRAARNVGARVILYGDKITDSMRKAISETKRRRNKQIAFNKKNGIIPKKIIKPVHGEDRQINDIKHLPKKEIPNLIIELEAAMKKAADELDFEEAIRIRNRIKEIKTKL